MIITDLNGGTLELSKTKLTEVTGESVPGTLWFLPLKSLLKPVNKWGLKIFSRMEDGVLIKVGRVTKAHPVTVLVAVSLTLQPSRRSWRLHSVRRRRPRVQRRKRRRQRSDEAAKAYDLAALMCFGERAVTNAMLGLLPKKGIKVVI